MALLIAHSGRPTPCSSLLSDTSADYAGGSGLCGHAACLAGRVDRGADAGANLRHSGTTRTGPYDMNAAFMLLQVHGWDSHAVTSGRRARKASHDSAPGTREHHGPQPGR